MRASAQTYPECPQCGTDLLVEGFTGLYDYVCWGCEGTFDGGDNVEI